MKEILEYISLITLSGAAISFVVGLVKWIDQRNREQEQKHYEAFHKMVGIASGVDETGKAVKAIQQVAAIYQLQHYKKYAFAAIPILKQLEFEFARAGDDPRNVYMKEAIRNTIDALSNGPQLGLK